MTEAAAAAETPRITVNGVGITLGQINAEVQYHPAENFPAAQEKAARALVIRELLMQEAQKKGFSAVRDEQSAIEELLKKEVIVPEPDRESCERYYNSNKARFVTSPFFEVSHVLFKAEEEQKAKDVLKILQDNPGKFSDLAKEHSSCSSAKDGGRLGQISKGQTTPEFEAALFKMRKGETSREPVKTRYGYHIIHVHEHAEGRELPFEAVQEWIADYLKQSVWQRAVSQYIGILAGKADIKGFNLKAADSPLVQ